MRIRVKSCAISLMFVPTLAWSVDLTPLKDNTIFSESSNLSAGGQLGIFVGSNNATPPNPPSRRGLLQFDVANGLPAGVAITGASLTLTLEMAGSGSSAPSISLSRLNVDWGEGNAGNGTLSGAGSPANPGDATWTESAHNGPTWTAGGDHAGVSASQTVTGNTVGSQFTWSSPTLLSDVIDWYSNPANNHGWELISSLEGTAQSVKTFYSKEFTSDSSRWPKLTVTYVPEPTAGLLALLASPLWLFYRRR